MNRCFSLLQWKVDRAPVRDSGELACNRSGYLVQFSEAVLSRRVPGTGSNFLLQPEIDESLSCYPLLAGNLSHLMQQLI